MKSFGGFSLFKAVKPKFLGYFTVSRKRESVLIGKAHNLIYKAVYFRLLTGSNVALHRGGGVRLQSVENIEIYFYKALFVFYSHCSRKRFNFGDKLGKKLALRSRFLHLGGICSEIQTASRHRRNI